MFTAKLSLKTIILDADKQVNQIRHGSASANVQNVIHFGSNRSMAIDQLMRKTVKSTLLLYWVHNELQQIVHTAIILKTVEVGKIYRSIRKMFLKII